MHDHDEVLAALVGQPNSGKSTVFNYLTGLHQTVANYPGVTVAKKSGHYHEGKRRIEVVDLPGTYSLTSYSQEERVTRDFLLLERPEVVVLVMDAANLRRHLYLAFQLRELQVPLVVCLNMMDIAQRRGFQIDVAKLEQILAVPVVPTVARCNHQHPAGKCNQCMRGAQERKSGGRKPAGDAPRDLSGEEPGGLRPPLLDSDAGLEGLRQQIIAVAQRHDHELRPDWKVDYGELEPLIAEIEAVFSSKTHLAQDFPTRWLAIKLLENGREARRIIQHHIHEPGWEELLNTCQQKIERYYNDHTNDRPVRATHISPGQHPGSETPSPHLPPCSKRESTLPCYRAANCDEAQEPRAAVSTPCPGLKCLATGREEGRIYDSPQKIIASKRNEYAEQIEREVVFRSSRPRRRSDRADRVLCHPIGGLFCVAAVLFLMFSLAFNLASGWSWFPWISATGTFEWQTPLGAIGAIFSVWIPHLLDSWFTLPDGDPRSLIYDGIVAGVGGVVMFIPIIFFIFCLVAALEQSGYMARVVVVMDRLMRFFGLHGHSIVPMILAGGVVGGCAVPAVMATRTMRERRERLLTIMVLPLMNCGGKVPIYALLISAFFIAYQGIMLAAIILISWVCALIAALVLGKWFVKGKASPLLIELPTYQMPMLRDVLRTAGMQCWEFIKRAGTIILIANIVLWALMYYPKGGESYAAKVGRFLEPVSQYAGFDWRDNVALIGGLAAKEVVVSSMITMHETDGRRQTADSNREPATASPHVAEESLAIRLRTEGGWTPLKAFVMLLFVMLYSPCLATCVVIWRETGHIKYMLLAILYTNALAFSLAVGVYQMGKFLG
ncbi:MAG: ferrous iron transporter B [Planctomycetaceae bacterium]|nr:ferrous iron transporter B [Planctomycetaceae bacterium]